MAGASTTDSTSPSPNKRVKITTPDSKSIIEDEPSNHHHRQEEQQSAEEDDSDTERCGICLSEDGRRAIRGKIDSCSHFFCFVCIMEWAKVESRCPFCKRRFTAIHRPPKEGVFASERVVNVPRRDQVYHLSGNATYGPVDPYAEVKCSVCHNMTDESLLLLCDLCDSAAHTYCVGLGATVPEGDWFCHDCALSRSEHDKTEVDTETDDKMISADSNVKLSAETNISIFDIVREPNIPGFGGCNSSVSSLPNNLPPAIIPGFESSASDEVSRPNKRSRNAVGNSAVSGARTLRVCRSVNSRIRALRENWRALQTRSLGFSSNRVESGVGSCRKGTVTAVFNYSSNESRSSSSTSHQSTSQDSFIEPKRDLYDIDKAWKMMNIAKSMQKNCKRTSSLKQISTKLSGRESGSKEATSSSGLHTSKIQQNETRNEEGTGRQMHYTFCHETEREKEKGKLKSPEMEKQKRMVMNIESTERVLPFHSPRLFQSPSSTKVQIQDGCHVNDMGPCVKNAQNGCRESSSNANTEGRPSCSTTLVGSVLQESTDSLDSRLEVGASKLDLPDERTRLENSCSKSKGRKEDNVKSEIQSLVKLNLKLLSKDKQLGTITVIELSFLCTGKRHNELYYLL
ncbi:hypothetical protein PTKIN_Ptkin04bG0052400 [Pterospermum kingtungense]